ncbi:MAG: acyltransferase [Acidimicrobiales bacterium]|nr:acyltransferase [Acidimicrobiales bacterium]
MTITSAAHRDDLFVFEKRTPHVATSSSRRIPYVPALDGLRGAAVLAVVLYHGQFKLFGHGLARGGFLGVDAFFVLSGFLITKLLLAEWRDTGRIDLAAFWSRRARRLLPALFIGLLLVAAYAAFVATPDTLGQLRSQAIATMFYGANWYAIYENQSYFAQFLFPTPLRHMWSLAIEEQFYLFWPLLVLGTLRWQRQARAVRWLALILAVASMVLMALLFMPGRDPSRVYYGTDTRLQSLAVGAALAAAVHEGLKLRDRRARSILNAIGTAALVILALVWVRTDDFAEWLYVGGFLLLALAVALVIFVCVQDDGYGPANPVRVVLEFKPLRWLGVISYGVYVYHWPVMVWLNVERTGLGPGNRLLALQLVVTLLLAWLSYRFIERPIRHGDLLRRLHFRPALVPVMALVTLGIIVVSTRGARATLSVRELATPPAEREMPTITSSSTTVSDAEVPAPSSEPPPSKVLLIGDSVSYSLGLGFEGNEQTKQVAVWNQGSLYCELINGRRREQRGKEVDASDTCVEWERDWTTAVDRFQPDLIVLGVGPWEVFDRQVDGQWLPFGSPEFDAVLQQKLDRVVTVLSERSGAPIVLLTTPRFERAESDESPLEWTRAGRERSDHLNELFRQVAAEHPNAVRIIDLGGYLCPPDAERCTDKIDGVLVRDDGIHYGEHGAKLIANWLAPQLREIALSHPSSG